MPPVLKAAKFAVSGPPWHHPRGTAREIKGVRSGQRSSAEEFIVLLAEVSQVKIKYRLLLGLQRQFEISLVARFVHFNIVVRKGGLGAGVPGIATLGIVADEFQR